MADSRRIAFPGTRAATRKFMAAAARRRLSPLVWISILFAAAFSATVGVLFLPEEVPPQIWWEREVQPHLESLHQAKEAGDWKAAREACARAIAKASERREEFAGRLAELRLEDRELKARQAREAPAQEAARAFRRKVDAFRAQPPPEAEAAARRQALLWEGREAASEWPGTQACESIRQDLKFLEALPPPPEPPTWIREKPKVDAALHEKSFARALGLLEAFAAGPAAPREKAQAAAYRQVVCTRAREDFRRLYGDGRAEALAREKGRRAAAEHFESERQRFRGTPPEQELERIAADLRR